MKSLKNFSLLLIYALMLMSVAFYNGAPMTEGDTGAYISQAFKLSLPEDRTPFYGTFLGISSMRTSLWFTILAQSFIVAYLLRRYIKFLIPGNDLYAELASMTAIISFTCVSWVAAYLMPDIFAGVLLLATLLYLYEQKQSKWQTAVYLVIIGISISIHNSHFLITALFAFVQLLYSFWAKRKELRIKYISLLGISVLFWLFMSTVNAMYGHGFTFSRGTSNFTVTRFAETGILNTYLDDSCGKKNLKLCAYKDQIPDYSWDFLWSSESPLQKTGGWDSNRADFKMIVHDVFTTPKYMRMYIQKSLISTGREMTQIQTPDKPTFQGRNTTPWVQINHYYADEIKEYNISRQNTGNMSAGMFNIIYFLFLILSTLWVLFYFKEQSYAPLIMLYKSILVYFVINAFVTATFSTVLYRYQYRIFWILPATNAILIIRHYYRSLKFKDAGADHL